MNHMASEPNKDVLDNFTLDFSPEEVQSLLIDEVENLSDSDLGRIEATRCWSRRQMNQEGGGLGIAIAVVVVLGLLIGGWVIWPSPKLDAPVAEAPAVAPNPALSQKTPRPRM